MKWEKTVFGLLLLVLALPVAAFALGKPNLELVLKVHRETVVKDDKGKQHTEWQEVVESQPGDVLRYTIQYTNTGDGPVVGAVINDPVPDGTRYIAGSATGIGAEISFSIDGKQFQPPPLLKYRVKKSDGSEEEFQVTPEMYKHIRWKLTVPVQAGETGTVGFMVKVK